MLCTSGWLDHCSGVNAIVKPSSNIKRPEPTRRPPPPRHQAAQDVRHDDPADEERPEPGLLQAAAGQAEDEDSGEHADDGDGDRPQHPGTRSSRGVGHLTPPSAGDVQIGPVADSSRVNACRTWEKTVLLPDLRTLS